VLFVAAEIAVLPLAFGLPLFALVFAAVFLCFLPAQQGIATTIAGVLAVLAPTIGPIAGGWITDMLSWRWRGSSWRSPASKSRSRRRRVWAGRRCPRSACSRSSRCRATERESASRPISSHSCASAARIPRIAAPKRSRSMRGVTFQIAATQTLRAPLPTSSVLLIEVSVDPLL
jgi:hypothetical protein